MDEIRWALLIFSFPFPVYCICHFPVPSVVMRRTSQEKLKLFSLFRSFAFKFLHFLLSYTHDSAMHFLCPCFLWVHVFLFITFNFPSPSIADPFLPSENVTLFGDANFRNNAISLTQELSCHRHYFSSSPSCSGVGRAFYVNPVRFLDSETNSTASFSCRFTFSIVSSPSSHSGDGIAFMIISDTDLVSFSSGYMGLPSISVNEQDSYFAVEFDTNFDPSLGDINGNHIGIDVDTILSIASVDAISEGIDLKSGRKITAWIEYRDAQKMARVWVGHSPIRPPMPILVSQIDLAENLKEYMHVGFSASNVMGSGIHSIDHWQFKTFGFTSSVTPIDMVEEGDCFFCYPENSTIATQQTDSTHFLKEKLVEMAFGLGGIAAFIVSAFVICLFLIKRKKASVEHPLRENQHCEFQTTKLPSRLSLSAIKLATRGFSRDRLVGEGTSAKVYKGSLPYGGDVAVKRFGKVNGCNSIDYLHNPFNNEFATMAGCLRHKNLVQLQGWCVEESELLLVYEYLPNGSLNRILHNNNSSVVLSWKQRVNIILGVASALTYLHEECERHIIHRDVKTCNIMLDADFNAKLGDFGLAEVYEHSCCDTREATLPAGTMGYLAPEYVYSGVPTVKTDVYSFGVVVLEVATGRKPVEDDGTVIVDYMWKMWEKKRLAEAGDPRLMGKFDVQEMERMLMVGLICVYPDHENRPRVRDAARILKGEAPLPFLPSCKPRVRLRPILPNDNEEILDVIGDRSSTDEAAYLTPRSRFN